MKFLVIVMIIRAIIKMVDKKPDDEEIIIEIRNDVIHPAAFRVR